LDANLYLDGLEAALIAELFPETTQIEMGLIERKIREGREQDRQIECRAIKRHQQIILRQFVPEALSVKGFAPDESRVAALSIESHNGDVTKGIRFEIETYGSWA
jgi:hypothetical protein